MEVVHVTQFLWLVVVEYIKHTWSWIGTENIRVDKTKSCPGWTCVPWQCEYTDSAPRLWSSTSVHGGSLVPPRNLSRKEKKTNKKNTHKQGLQMTKYYRKSLSSKDKGQFCFWKSPDFESRAKTWRPVWQLLIKTVIKQSSRAHGKLQKRYISQLEISSRVKERPSEKNPADAQGIRTTTPDTSAKKAGGNREYVSLE